MDRGLTITKIINWKMGICISFLLGIVIRIGYMLDTSSVDALKVISCIASCLTLFVAKKLFEAFEISEEGSFYGMLLVAFTPVFYLTVGGADKDALGLFFSSAVLLVTLYFKETPSWKNTIILAVLYGLGMMAHISVAVPALYTIWVFGRKLSGKRTGEGIKKYFDKENSSLYGKFLVFGSISLPGGLWYLVKNGKAVYQELTDTLQQNAEHSLYCGKVSLVQRFMIPDVANMLKTPYVDPLTDHNLEVYLLKTELFGEFQYETGNWIPVIFLFLNFIITSLIAGYCAYVLIRHKQQRNELVIAGWMCLFAGTAVITYYVYPFSSAMDVRHYAMLTICKALLVGKFLDYEADQAYRDEGKLLQELIKKAGILFAAVSCIMYCLVKWKYIKI